MTSLSIFFLSLYLCSGKEAIVDIIPYQQNYPICEHLPSYICTTDTERCSSPYSLRTTAHEQPFSALIAVDKLQCGWESNYDFVHLPVNPTSSFPTRYKRTNIKSWLGKECLYEIEPARQRLLYYLHNHLCTGITEDSGEVLSYMNRGNALLDAYGIVYTGEARHFKGIFQSVLSIQLTLSTTRMGVGALNKQSMGWPRLSRIEIWVNWYAMPLCKRIFNYHLHQVLIDTEYEPMRVECMQFSTIQHGLRAKIQALLSTSLSYVLFLDSDTLVTRDVREVFLSDQFRNDGVVLWADRWGYACTMPAHEDLHRRHDIRLKEERRSGWTITPDFVLWSAAFPGLNSNDVSDTQRQKNQKDSSRYSIPDTPALNGGNSRWNSNDPTHVQEAETGQIVFDLRRSARPSSRLAAAALVGEADIQAADTETTGTTTSTGPGELIGDQHQYQHYSHRGVLELALMLMNDSRFFRRVLQQGGDKDAIRFAYLITNVPFHYASYPNPSHASSFPDTAADSSSSSSSSNSDSSSRHSNGREGVDGGPLFPGIAMARNGKRDSIVHYHYTYATAASTSTGTSTRRVIGDAELPLFLHQLKHRDSSAFLQIWRVPPSRRSSSPATPTTTACTKRDNATAGPSSSQRQTSAAASASSSYCVVKPELVLSTPPGAKAIQQLAARIYHIVDELFDTLSYKDDALLFYQCYLMESIASYTHYWVSVFRIATISCDLRFCFIVTLIISIVALLLRKRVHANFFTKSIRTE